ncbi:DUF1194 domain-containing protein [Aliisedimentitalea sp. MJ-SS2]|uniref:DUF1194 domain-containing protein n=1 Tax=Aliisedimentitalea sp. MJ-SS2 TaxID=3049795 RepID=UPI00292D297B|nr:DUF1194 domain-containing protein [Alisedimentitalea sp. MJ-SS2]
MILCVLASVSYAEEVDVELFLAVDMSQSMSFEELDLQRQGYAAALTSPEVLHAIERGPLGKIAITYVEWAGVGRMRTIVPWTRLDTPDDAAEIAEEIATNFETTQRGTSMSSVMFFAANSFEANKFRGLRKVLDISGDGPNNTGPPVAPTRDRLLTQGIIINGLPLMPHGRAWDEWSIPDLDLYYAECVIGGPGAFVLPVRDWSEFSRAVRRKLVLELAARPAQPERLWRSRSYDCLVGEKIWHRNMRLDFFSR